jgi:hypothetical protein
MREGAAVCMPNLDVDLVFHDPKTRSMREVPRPACPALRRRTGRSGRQCLRPRFDRPTRRRRRCRRRPLQRLLVSSAPPSTSTEAAARTARTEPLRARAAIRGAASAAGGANHTQPPPRELLLAQSDAHVEYERAARLPVVGGAARLAACSRSEEDVHPNRRTHRLALAAPHVCV